MAPADLALTGIPPVVSAGAVTADDFIYLIDRYQGTLMTGVPLLPAPPPLFRTEIILPNGLVAGSILGRWLGGILRISPELLFRFFQSLFYFSQFLHQRRKLRPYDFRRSDPAL